MAPPIFLLTSTAPRTERHADCIARIDIELNTAFDRHGLDIVSRATVTPGEILQFITTQGSDIALFHFGGRGTDFQGLLDAASAAGIPSLPTHLANLPQLKFVFLSYCSQPRFVSQLLEAGIETVVGTSHRLTQEENDEFALAFYSQFITTNRTAKEVFEEAISAARISIPDRDRYFVGLHGRENLRRWWFNSSNTEDSKQRIPNVIGNDAFLAEQLGRLRRDWQSVVNSGQAVAMLAYHSTVLRASQGRTVEEIQREFSRWGNRSAELAERLKELSLLTRTNNNGQLVYHGDSTLNDAIFRSLYTSNNNLAGLRQLLADLAYLIIRIQRSAVAICRYTVDLPAHIWQWCQNHARAFAIASVGLGALLMSVLALQGIVLRNQIRVDLAQYVGGLSSPTLFLLSRQNVDESFMERAMEWFTGVDPLRPSEVNFQLIGPLHSLGALSGEAEHLPWHRVLFTADQNYLMAAGDDSTIDLWPLANLQAHSSVYTDANSVFDLAYDPATRNLAFTDERGMVRLHNLDTDVETAIADHGQGNTLVRFNNDGNSIISGGTDGRISIYAVATGEVRTFMTEPRLSITALTIAPTGPAIAYATEKDNIIHVWDSVENRQIANLQGHAARVTSLEFQSDDQFLLSTSHDYTVRLWPISNFATGEILVTQRNQLPHAHFLANSSLLVTTGDPGTLQIWQVDNHTLLQTEPVNDRGISALTVNSDGKAIAVASWDGSISLWRLESLLPPLVK